MLSDARDLCMIPFSSSMERAERTCLAIPAREEVETNLEDLMWFSRESLYHSDTSTTLSEHCNTKITTKYGGTLHNFRLIVKSMLINRGIMLVNYIRVAIKATITIFNRILFIHYIF